ncbi:hypothetical protein, conserved [Leishmania lindenbergi]|uniref:Uncharacterized protein n=1 Tax=Leishmania lindenbergi TaxID=651832 RepID=A0AAW2ZXN1_9TRYP
MSKLTGRGVGTTATDNAAGIVFNCHTGLHDRHFWFDSDREENVFSGVSTRSSLTTAGDAIATSKVAPRQRFHVCPLSERGSRVGVNGGSGASAIFHQNRESTARASSYADRAGRTAASTHTAVIGSGKGAAHYCVGSSLMNSCNTHSCHHATSLLYNSLDIRPAAVQSHSHSQSLLVGSSPIRRSKSLWPNQAVEFYHGVDGVSFQHHQPSP